MGGGLNIGVWFGWWGFKLALLKEEKNNTRTK